MMVTNWQLPTAPLRGSAVATNALALAALMALAWTARAGWQLGASYPLKAGALFAGVMLIAVGFLRGRHPFARFGPANQVTTARAILVALLASLIGDPGFRVAAVGAAGVAAIVSALDGVDGWLARRSRMASAFGARFDMEIDALLVLVLSVLAWRYDKAGAWVVASGLLRYLFVAAGWIWGWLEAPLPPSRRRQAICVLQTAALTLAILPVIAPPLSASLAAAALAALCVSFLTDILWLWRAGKS